MVGCGVACALSRVLSCALFSAVLGQWIIIPRFIYIGNRPDDLFCGLTGKYRVPTCVSRLDTEPSPICVCHHFFPRRAVRHQGKMQRPHLRVLVCGGVFAWAVQQRSFQPLFQGRRDVRRQGRSAIPLPASVCRHFAFCTLNSAFGAPPRRPHVLNDPLHIISAALLTCQRLAAPCPADGEQVRECVYVHGVREW